MFSGWEIHVKNLKMNKDRHRRGAKHLKEVFFVQKSGKLGMNGKYENVDFSDDFWKKENMKTEKFSVSKIWNG